MLKFPKILFHIFLLTILYVTHNTCVVHAFTLYPEDKTSLRSFDGGSSVLRLAFDALKASSFMEDRVIMHFNVKHLSGQLMTASIDIPLNDIDPDEQDGSIGVYMFPGDGVVSVDEWNYGTFIHEFSGIQGGRHALSLDITEIMQCALDDGCEYLSFALRVRSGTDRYWLDGSNNVPESTLSFTITNSTISRAVTDGYLHGYVYTWDGLEYVPIGINSQDTEIQPWQGFWMMLPNDTPVDGIDMLIPALDDPPVPVPPLNLVRGYHYLIAPPLLTDQTDLNASSLGQQLGADLYEDTWRVSKWHWDNDTYQVYQGPDPDDDFMALQLGQSMWLQLLSGPPLTIMLQGQKADPQFGFYPIPLPKSSHDTPYTSHMIGNPYWYPFKLSDCMVYVPETDSTDVSGTDPPVQINPLWEIEVKLEAPDGSARDTHNSIGIIDGQDADKINAFDLEPPGEYIRLALLDSSEEDSIRYAYDYRPKINDADEVYTWTIELSSTYQIKDTFLSFENIKQVPDTYSITLENMTNGGIQTITDDYTVHVPLYGGTPIIYTLTVLVPVVAVQDDGLPNQFGIIGVSPNPFNPSTLIHYSLEQPGNATISIYNIGGQIVATLLNEHVTEGRHSIVWDAGDQASGVYFVRMETNNNSDVSKILLMK